MRALIRVMFLACVVSCGQPANVTRVVVDCTIANRAQIEALLSEFRQILVGEAPNWKAVLDKALAAGETIGGCALAELAQTREAPQTTAAARSALEIAPPDRSARSTLEEFRAQQARNPSYRTSRGEI